MRALLDANVLFPTVLREILIGAAGAGLYEPIWSERILEEWARAARKIGPEGEAIARGEIAVLKAGWPHSAVRPRAGDEARLWLPDSADIHVLAAAISGSADVIVTLNKKDFPRNILAEEGLDRTDPDTLLLGFLDSHPEVMREIAGNVRAEAERLSEQPWPMRKLLKKAGLYRLGRALED